MTIHDVDCFIDGGVVTATDTFDVIDPSTGKTLAAVSRGGPAQIDYAVKAAQSASKAWSRLAARDRADHLRAVGAAIAAQVEVRYFEFYANAVEQFFGDSPPATR